MFQLPLILCLFFHYWKFLNSKFQGLKYLQESQGAAYCFVPVLIATICAEGSATCLLHDCSNSNSNGSDTKSGSALVSVLAKRNGMKGGEELFR